MAASAMTTVSGIPSASTRAGRSSCNQPEPGPDRIESRISSYSATRTAAAMPAYASSPSATIPSTGAPIVLESTRRAQRSVHAATIGLLASGISSANVHGPASVRRRTVSTSAGVATDLCATIRIRLLSRASTALSVVEVLGEPSHSAARNANQANRFSGGPEEKRACPAKRGCLANARASRRKRDVTESSGPVSPVLARRRFLAPLALAQFICSFAGSNMNVMINDITEDLDTTVQGVQAAITLFLLIMAILMIPASKLTDRWGRKRCFTIGLVLYGIGAL